MRALAVALLALALSGCAQLRTLSPRDMALFSVRGALEVAAVAIERAVERESREIALQALEAGQSRADALQRAQGSARERYGHVESLINAAEAAHNAIVLDGANRDAELGRLFCEARVEAVRLSVPLAEVIPCQP